MYQVLVSLYRCHFKFHHLFLNMEKTILMAKLPPMKTTAASLVVIYGDSFNTSSLQHPIGLWANYSDQTAEVTPNGG